ncbi:MAG: hypothetical protein KC503_18745 [Myxococcales bacterium]|nr:hypothetical protein [Myxococcales bacterium]
MPEPSSKPATTTWLHLLDAAPLPPGARAISSVDLVVSPGGGYAGVVSDKVLLRVYSPAGGRLEQTLSYPLPPSARAVALHPSGRRIALCTPHQLQLVDVDTHSVHTVDVPDAHKALTFSHSGDVLWASVEDSGGKISVRAYRAEDLTPISSAVVAGMPDAQHSLMGHPTREVVAVEVSAGPDGSWVSFVELDGDTVRESAPGVSRDGAPFSLAGFAADGKSFAGVTNEAVLSWSYPDCVARAPHPLREALSLEGWSLCWQAARTASSLVAPVSDEDAERFKLVVLDGTTLEPAATLDWEPRDQSYLHGVHALSGEHLLAVGDRRLGLFELKRS